MANQQHLELLKRGGDAWNQWRREHPAGEIDLSGASLTGANLYLADLRFANLEGATLTQAILTHADLEGATLINASLGGADLTAATLTHANLKGATLINANLRGADLRAAVLTEANLERAVLVETNLTGATLTRCSIYGISVWNVRLEGALQDDLIITHAYEPIIRVDNLKIAQFIYLLLDHKELRDVFNAVTERGVLLLGRFSDGGLEMLQFIAAELRKLKYLPILFDFERPDSRDYTETVKTLAGLARFVIVDLSGPSIPQELYATVPHFAIPFVPIIEAGRKVHSMFRDLLKYPWVFPPVTFTDKEQLLEVLPSRIIEPAETRCQERQRVLHQLFHH
jgi:hypothetical protein